MAEQLNVAVTAQGSERPLGPGERYITSEEVEALALGVPGLRLIDGEAPAALNGLDRPDAVFVGGGLSAAVFEACWDALKPLGRFVANAATGECEAAMMALHARHGGELCRLDVARHAEGACGPDWQPFPPVMQWSLVKR